MADNLLDLVNEELTDIIGVALRELGDFTWLGSKEVMLRQLRQNYDTLSLEQIDTIRAALGHTHTEERPCEVCQIMAVKEQQLNED